MFQVTFDREKLKVTKKSTKQTKQVGNHIQHAFSRLLRKLGVGLVYVYKANIHCFVFEYVFVEAERDAIRDLGRDQNEEAKKVVQYMFCFQQVRVQECT